MFLSLPYKGIFATDHFCCGQCFLGFVQWLPAEPEVLAEPAGQPIVPAVPAQAADELPSDKEDNCSSLKTSLVGF